MLVSIITAVLVAALIRITSVDRFQQFIIEQQRTSLEQALSTYYAGSGSWAGVSDNWQTIQSRTFVTPAGVDPGSPPESARFIGGPGRGNFFGLADAQGKVLVAADPQYPAGTIMTTAQLKAGTQITLNGQKVGTILVAAQPPGFTTQEQRYLGRTYEALIFASLGALLVAILVGTLLARGLSGPLRALTRAAQNITSGQLDSQVKVRGSDEIGQLGLAFNSMSQEVARVNQLRKQMTADIAHDLRTPLTVISGYIESMRDGVLKPTPERLALIYSEIERLQNLVGDLRDLSLADAGELQLNPQPLAPKTLLEKAAELFRYPAEQKGIALEVETDENLPEIHADEARMMQVLGNLITNSLRYTNPNGKITLTANACDGGVEICVKDTGEGIDPEDLPYIFNRFQRGDKSRHAENSESGLGLAIVKTLVESHGGSTSAESERGAGTTVRLKMPA